jgi:hypothetical protein
LYICPPSRKGCGITDFIPECRALPGTSDPNPIGDKIRSVTDEITPKSNARGCEEQIHSYTGSNY